MNTDNPPLAMDELPSGIMEVSKERVILRCNTYVLNLTNKPRHELIGQRIESVVSLASKIFIDSYLYPLLIKDSIANEIQITIKDNDNQKIPIVANMSLKDDGSSVWSFIRCDNRDKIFEELLRARDSIKIQTDKLSKSYVKVKSEHAFLQVFSRSLSHDFTSTIRRAHLLISVVQEDLISKKLDIPDELKYLDRAQNSIGLVLKLIDSLLDFISIENADSHNQPVQLNEVVDEAITLNGEYIERGAIVERGDLPAVLGDSGLLNILFKNLIGNGFKYNANAGKISIYSESSTQKGYCIIKVKDNGIGISKKYLQNIFEPFVRLHSKKTYDGSGLGLSIVQKIIEKHKGEIFVESDSDKGSTFILSLPLAAKER